MRRDSTFRIFRHVWQWCYITASCLNFRLLGCLIQLHIFMHLQPFHLLCTGNNTIRNFKKLMNSNNVINIYEKMQILYNHAQQQVILSNCYTLMFIIISRSVTRPLFCFIKLLVHISYFKVFKLVWTEWKNVLSNGCQVNLAML